MSIFYNYVKSSVWKASKNLIRDFSELELLQSGKSQSIDRFVSRSFTKTKELLYKELSYLNFKSISFNGDQMPTEDGLHILISELEGQTNLKKALPFFGIAIVQQKILNGSSEILSCVMALPALGVMLYAEDGQGAWREGEEEKSTSAGRRLRSSGEEELSHAICNKNFSKIEDRFAASRDFGSATYDIASFASGKFDGICVNNDNVILKYALQIFAKETGAFFKEMDSTKSIAVGAYLAKYFK